MIPNWKQTLTSVIGLILGLSGSAVCQAHFLWLNTITAGNQPHAFLYFGETATDEAYHMPERLTSTEVWQRSPDGKRIRLEAKLLETDDRIGLIAPIAEDRAFVLETTRQYGVYGKSLLVYYAKHIRADSPKQLNAAGPSTELKLDIVPRIERRQVELTVHWNGEPLPGATVRYAVGDTDTEKVTTNAEGQVRLKQVDDGLITVLTNHLDEDSSGEVEGQKYVGVLHYASLTFNSPHRKRNSEKQSANSEPRPALAPLPEPVSSFGAAVADGWLYVYSGHTGEEHQHSAANLSKYFRRIALDGGCHWEELPMQRPLQGLALVAHGGKLYRVGGLDARNATTDEEEDLHSVAEFNEFDPSSGTWRMLEPLPAPRSSHNAVVIGDRLYVVGGWQLAGEAPGEWQFDALKYDFANPQAGWQRLPEPPFTRRALALSYWDDRLVAIGGMDSEGEVSQRVDVFDPSSGEWSEGPRLPGDGMAGFGGSACHLDGRLYVSGLQGVVYRLSTSGSEWEEAGRLDQRRFFHQLLPLGDGRLLAIGGASRTGHLADAEVIEVGESKRQTSREADASLSR